MTRFDPRALLRPELAELKSYAPAPGKFDVRLDANEAPALLSEGARARLAEVSASVAWEKYPDATVAPLRAAIAARCGVKSDQVLVGVGSDELITLLMTVVARPQEPSRVTTVLTTTPSFVMYQMSARVRGQRVVEVPLDASWDIATEDLLRAIETSAPSLIFIATPNNPTGTMASPDRLEAVIESAAQRRCLVVVDEAYIDYSDRHQLELLERHAHVVILRTLSKVGFAALRVGWMLGHAGLVAELDKARLPYNISTPSQALATVALTELADEIDATCRSAIEERRRVHEALERFEAVRVVPSQANFLWLELSGDAGRVYEALAQRGVLVRSFHSRGGRLAHCLRVTIGTSDQNDRFLQAIEQSLP